MNSLGSYNDTSSSSSLWRSNIHQQQIAGDIFPQEMVQHPLSLPPHSIININNINATSLSPSLISSYFGINNIISSSKTISLDSLDCLLSATNSINTESTSIEDDGISVIFSAPVPPLEITKKPSSKRTHDQISHPLNFSDNKNPKQPKSSNISFGHPSNSSNSSEELDSEAIAQMKEMIYRAAAFRPVNLGVEIAEKPKRKNVKISRDPQTVAARQRRERISERIRVLQRLVPGGNKMDTASMLDEAANYLKFLRSQVKALESFSSNKIISQNNTSSYKLDHPLVNFPNHNLMPFGSIPMQNLFPHQTIIPSPIHQPKN